MKNTEPNRSLFNVSHATRRETTVLRSFTPVRKPWAITAHARAWLAPA